MPGLAYILPFTAVAVWSIPQVANAPAHAQAPTTRQAAVHVLQRLSFGPRPGDVERVMAMGMDRWIDLQLQPSKIDDRVLEHALRRYHYLNDDPQDLMEMFPRPAQLLRAVGGQASASDSAALRAAARNARAFTTELLSARVARAVASERQLNEVLVDFWLNHFSVFLGKNATMRYYLPQFEREAIRPHVLGRFRDLLGAVARSPAMLVYLDNAQSVADSTRPTLVSREVGERRIALARRIAARRRGDNRIDTAQFSQLLQRRPTGLNENYARELLELHTLGVDGGYTQQDVIEVARVLTGWTVRRGRGDGFLFNPVAHDAGEKRILGQRFPPGRGEDEGEAVLDLLAQHPSTARHIARKLAVRFVADDPSPALVDRAANVFARTDGDLREVVRAIVTSAEFRAPTTYGAKVKSPFEVVVSAIRALGGSADSTALTAALVARMGQPIYGHQAPDGWPETGDEWMNTGAILNRINFGLTLAGRGVPGTSVSAWPGYAGLRAAPRGAQVEGVIDALLAGQASAETRQILASGDNPMLTTAASDSVEVSGDAAVMGSEQGVELTRRRLRARGAPPAGQGSSNPSARRNQNVPDRANPLQRLSLGAPRNLAGLDQIIGLAIGSPEFQRR